MGNIFQQLYNMVDSIVVGKFVSKDALAESVQQVHQYFLFLD